MQQIENTLNHSEYMCSLILVSAGCTGSDAPFLRTRLIYNVLVNLQADVMCLLYSTHVPNSFRF